MCKLWYNIQVATYGPGSWLFPWLVCHNVEVRMRTETCIVRASEKKHVFPSAQLRLSLVLGGWLQIEKYPINVGFLAENLPGFFFSDCSLRLYRRKNIYSSIVMSGGCTFEGSNIIMGFYRFSLLSSLEMFLIFIFSEFDGDVGK